MTTHPFLTGLSRSTRWLANRDAYLEAARGCRNTLINPDGYWRCAKDDPRVKAAVGVWVDRARNAHAIALGRRPVIEKVVVIEGSEAVRGSLYVEQNREG